MEVGGKKKQEKKGRFKYDFAPTNARVKIEFKERERCLQGYCTNGKIFTVGSVEEKEIPNLQRIHSHGENGQK